MQQTKVIYAVLALVLILAVAQSQVSNLQFVDKKWSAYVIENIPRARQLAVSADQSVLIVGSLNNAVYGVLLEKDAQGKLVKKAGSEVKTIATGLSNAHGVAIDDATGNIYVGFVDGILVIQDGIKDLKAGNTLRTPVTLRTLPKTSDSDGMHNRRHLRMKNDRIYVSIGAPCDACEVEDPMGTIASLKFTTFTEADQDWKIEARGVRNTVGFQFHPTTGDLWFTDNGVDTASGSAKDELNYIPSSSGVTSTLHFGFPYCYDKDFVDEKFNTNNTCAPYQPASYVLGEHVAALGMTFLTVDSKPMIFIAERGSMDITNPTGYRITTVDPSNPQESSYQVFVDGFFKNGDSWGRPVDVFATNGQLIVSDDKAGAVYGFVYSPEEPVDSSNASSSLSLTSFFVLALLALVQLFVQH